MSTPVQPQVIVVRTQKSPMLAAVLGFFFGPLGLLYVGFVPALIMFAVCLVVGALTVGIGLFITWPMSGAVGWSRANLYNKKLLSGQ
jgi:hypothetical protein